MFYIKILTQLSALLFLSCFSFIMQTKNVVLSPEAVITLSHSHAPTLSVHAALYLPLPISILFSLHFPLPPSFCISSVYLCRNKSLSLSVPLAFCCRPSAGGLEAFNEIYGEISPHLTVTHIHTNMHTRQPCHHLIPLPPHISLSFSHSLFSTALKESKLFS